MKTHTSVWKFGCGLLLCLLGLQGARAQKQDVELDATAIDFHSLFVGRNGRFGFPVFVVLDENGKVMHIQDSSFLEEGQGYNQEKVLRFFKGWTPKSIETQQ